MYDQASTEPLDVIRANECESQVGSLATNRFRALWNEIERLQAALKPFADMAMDDLCLPSFPALTELVNHAVRAKAAYEQKAGDNAR